MIKVLPDLVFAKRAPGEDVTTEGQVMWESFESLFFPGVFASSAAIHPPVSRVLSRNCPADVWVVLSTAIPRAFFELSTGGGACRGSIKVKAIGGSHIASPREMEKRAENTMSRPLTRVASWTTE